MSVPFPYMIKIRDASQYSLHYIWIQIHDYNPRNYK